MLRMVEAKIAKECMKRGQSDTHLSAGNYLLPTAYCLLPTFLKS